MPKLICEIPESLMQALSARQAATGGTLSHLVMSLLAEQLGTEYATLFQVSTAGALVEGVFDGVVTIRSLREHGDMGLGTFDALDGEMLAVDGRFFSWQFELNRDAHSLIAAVSEESDTPPR